jgi:hypothetical protein
MLKGGNLKWIVMKKLNALLMNVIIITANTLAQQELLRLATANLLQLVVMIRYVELLESEKNLIKIFNK